MKSVAQLMLETAELLASMPTRFKPAPKSDAPALMHYCGDSSNPDWLREMADIESEESWTPAQRCRRIVSRDFLSGAV